MLSAILTGQGTDFAGGGLASALGHAIGPRCGLANGIVNAIVLPHTLRFNAAYTRTRLWKLGASLPGADKGASAQMDQDPLQAIAAVESLLDRLALPRRLRDIGLARADLTDVVAHAQADFFLRRNPRPVKDGTELLALLQACW